MIPESLMMEGIKSSIKKLMENLITPKLEKFIKSCKLKYDEYLIPQREHFEEYLFRSYRKYNIVNTLVLNNEQRLLRDLYVPLTLVKRKYQWDNGEKVLIEKYPVDLVKTYNKILITDTAGMGKSTLSKRLLLDVIENGHGIPVYIELRRLSKDRPILDDIHNQINSLTKDFNRKLLLQFIQTGGFVFFLDGYDEVAVEKRNEVTEDVQDFISKAGSNVFFLTSRPEHALASFGDFQVFSINPLQKKEAYQLLRNYDDRGDVSQSLVEELKSGRHETINEFMKNPLLVSLLFAAYNHKKEIPIEKHIFYRNVYDAYFDDHDLTKGGGFKRKKQSGLNIDKFNRVLRHVGYISFKSQKIEFEKDALLLIIKKAKDYCPDLVFNEHDFLEDLLIAVPLFCEDGHYYRWVHKSLQEYFAAQFIYQDSKVKQDAILKALYASNKLEKYINLLDLYYDIDIWGYKKNILLPLCESYVAFYNSNIFKSKTIKISMVERRISLLFLREVSIERDIKYKLNAIGSISDAHRLNQNIFSQLGSFKIRCGDDVVTINEFHPKHLLLRLLRQKQKELFMSFKDIPNGYNFPRYFYSVINVHTGDNSPDKYTMINYYLEELRPEFNCFFDYAGCKKEIENIKSTLGKKEDNQDLEVDL